MNRKNIRVFAANKLGLKTSGFEFVKTLEELKDASERMGFPCVIKPVMSSSGHGQSIAKSAEDIETSWEVAKEARGDASELIVEEFVPFDYEITLLTVRNETGTVFCDAIGHVQKDGDFILSWQPMDMTDTALQKAKDIAKAVTDGLGGRGIFGVEFFVKGEEVYFSELSPRPHDTGMVTLITQSQSQFALHVRAVLGLPLDYTTYGSGACGAYKASNESANPTLSVPDDAFAQNSFVRVFFLFAVAGGQVVDEAVRGVFGVVPFFYAEGGRAGVGIDRGGGDLLPVVVFFDLQCHLLTVLVTHRRHLCRQLQDAPRIFP
jgi:phosphoribosylglycinamide formyltransferase 2